MRKDTRGSTLVAAVAVIMIIMIILGASLTIASSYYKRSVNENTKKQVYLSAKSSAEVIAEYIGENKTELIPANNNEQIVISNMSVEDEHIDLKGYVLRIDEDTLKIVMEATFDDYQYKIQVIMKYNDLVWSTNSYCEAKEDDKLC
ncbi:MAG: hypothetical protein PHQ89_04130 [Bacilli bacterium]|nr:hypothetical protein [Bacilli bacterium]